MTSLEAPEGFIRIMLLDKFTGEYAPAIVNKSYVVAAKQIFGDTRHEDVECLVALSSPVKWLETGINLDTLEARLIDAEGGDNTKIDTITVDFPEESVVTNTVRPTTTDRDGQD